MTPFYDRGAVESVPRCCKQHAALEVEGLAPVAVLAMWRNCKHSRCKEFYASFVALENVAIGSVNEACEGQILYVAVQKWLIGPIQLIIRQ